MSQLMFWNKQNNNTNTSNNNSINDGNKKNNRNWLHNPEQLLNGHIAFLVKFFGHLPVEQAKGIEVVKDAIRKLQFAQQMKKVETGTQEKFKKVEITVSVDGLAIQEPRTHKILHQYPLHNISYCADEKGVKKFFSFIAKTVKPQTTDEKNNNGLSNNLTNNSNNEESHECFVFISNKLASDITLTIGQAFDLAYRKFINNVEKTDGNKVQEQQRIAELEKTVSIYKNRLHEMSLAMPKAELEKLLFKMNIKDILEISTNDNIITNGNDETENSTMNTSSNLPIVPSRSNIPSQNNVKSTNQKMDELLLNSDSDSDFDPRADESQEIFFDKNDNKIANDIFGFEPSKSYGQQLFFNNNDNKFNNNNGNSNSNNNNNNNNSNELHRPPPLLAPPPKVATPRRSNQQMSNNNCNTALHANNSTDLFGSDPFDTNNSIIFKTKLSTISVDDFSLESLDPLKK